MKIQHILIGIIAILLVVILFQYKQPNVNEIATTIETAPTTTLTTAPKTSVFKTDYVDGCMDGDLSKYNYCNCTYNRITSIYGEQKIVEMGVEYLNEDMSESSLKIMTEATMYCLDKY